MTSLLLSKVIVIRSKEYLSKLRGCRYIKLIDFIYKIGRYRYRKNLIINNGSLPLVGIVVHYAARACSSHCRNNVISYIEASRVLRMRTHITPSMIVIAMCAASYILNECA